MQNLAQILFRIWIVLAVVIVGFCFVFTSGRFFKTQGEVKFETKEIIFREVDMERQIIIWSIILILTAEITGQKIYVGPRGGKI